VFVTFWNEIACLKRKNEIICCESVNIISRLFVFFYINFKIILRYGADDESGSKDGNVQKKRLEDLLKKAQKRKETAAQNESPEQKNEIVKKKRRKSKTKMEENLCETDTALDNDEPAGAVEPGENNSPDGKLAKISSEQQFEGFTVIGRDQFRKVKEVNKQYIFSTYIRFMLNVLLSNAQELYHSNSNYNKQFIYILFQVKGVAPKWLAKPTVVSVDMKHLDFKIDDLPKLKPFLRKSLQENGVTDVFPGLINI